MTEQLRLQKRFRQRRTVDFDKGRRFSVAVYVERVGDELLARPGLPGDQNRDLRRSHLLHNLQKPGHRGTLPDDALPVEFFTEFFFEIFIFFFQRTVLRRPGNPDLQFVKIKRLGEIIVRTFFQCADRCFHRSVSRHEDYRNRRIDLPDLLECFDPGNVHHPDVHQNQIKSPPADFFNGTRAVIRLKGLITPASQEFFQHQPVSGIIIHN